MQFTIRDARKEDMGEALSLIKELAKSANKGHEVEITKEELERDGFGSNPLFNCILAEANGEIKGIVFTHLRYSTWKGKTLHFENLIVKTSARRKGLGKGLFTEVVKRGHILGVKRIQWEVLDSNDYATKFYEDRQAIHVKELNVYYLKEEAIANLISY